MSHWHEHFQRARAAMELTRWELGHEEIVKALADDPQVSLLHATRAEICYRQRNFEEARAAAQEAIALDPDWQGGYYWLAWCLMSDFLAGPDRSAEAIRVAALALACDPDDADSHYVRSAASRFAGLTQEAELNAVEGLRIDPEHIGCLEVLAWAQVESHRDGEAETTLRRWLQINPESVGAHESLARITLRTERFAEAFQHASSAIQAEPDRAELRELHGEVVRRQHLLARFFLWSVKPWEYCGYLMVAIAMTPLFALAFAPKLGGWPGAVLAALALLFALGFGFYGVLGILAAETIIAHSSRFSALVPELRSVRSIYAFGWIAGAAALLAVLVSAITLNPHAILLTGNAIAAGVAVMIARWAPTRARTWVASLACAIPAGIQITALCWLPERDRGAVPTLVLAAWCITIVFALIASGRAT